MQVGQLSAGFKSRGPVAGNVVGSVREMKISPMRRDQPQMGSNPPAGDAAAAVYVAVGRDIAKNRANLLWTLDSFIGEKIVLLHVQNLPQASLDVLLQSALLNQEMLHEFIERDWKEIMKSMKEYQEICAQYRMVESNQLVRKSKENEVLSGQLEIGQGLLELIAQHGIQRLVMGATADESYSMQMMKPSHATYVNAYAPPSCQIWFICNGTFIGTRQITSYNNNYQKEPFNMLAQSAGTPNASMKKKNSLKGLITDAMRFGGQVISPKNFPSSTRRQNSISTAGSQTSFSNLSISSHAGMPYGEHEAMNNVQQEPISCVDWRSSSGGETSNSSRYSFSQQVWPPQLEQPRGASSVVDRQPSSFGFGGQISVSSVPSSQAGLYSEISTEESESQTSEQAHDIANEELLSQAEIEVFEKEVVKDMEELLDKFKKIEEAHRRTQQELETFHQKQQKYLERKLELLRIVRHQKKSMKEQQEKITEMEGRLRKITELPTFTEFSSSEVTEATKDFHGGNILGKGGFGCVYKGFLRCTDVAIKTLATNGKQGITEFNQEINVLSRVRHPNLVTLIGACTDPSALIYEFLPNGSLEDRLRRKNGSPPLTWQARTRIATEICSALLFLHSFGIVHGDLKPANVLLDMNLTAKIGDFGICRVIGVEGAGMNSTATTVGIETDPKGTFSYIDPEFVNNGILTAKSDIFAFGVIILQLVTGWPPLWIRREVEKFDLQNHDASHAIVDPSVKGWPLNHVMKLKELGMKCCDTNRKLRPKCDEIWECLSPMRDSLS